MCPSMTATRLQIWRTTANAFVPQEFVLLHKGVTEFKGVDFRDAAETRKLPLAWVLNPKAWKYTMDAASVPAASSESVSTGRSSWSSPYSGCSRPEEPTSRWTPRIPPNASRS